METPTAVPFLCHFCDNTFRTSTGLSCHLRMKTKCARMLATLEMARGMSVEREEEPAEGGSNEVYTESETVGRTRPRDETSYERGEGLDEILDEMDREDGNFEPEDPADFNAILDEWDVGGESGGGGIPTSGDNRNPESRYVLEPFPGPAGQPVGVGNSPFNTFLSPSSSPIDPSSPSPTLKAHPSVIDPELWELARWLMSSGLTAGARESFFKLTNNVGRLPWKSEKDFMKVLDSLPHGPDWTHIQHTVPGDVFDEPVEIWLRDPVKCVADLISNPALASCLQWAPIRLYKTNSSGEKERVFNEMWTGDRWWELQTILAKDYPDATIVPLIIASDKTQLSLFSGDKSAWPVYLTIGNLPKSLRRKVGLRITILIGYIPCTHLTGISNKEARSAAQLQLFHKSMSTILATLKTAGECGVRMLCGDSNIRHIFPILASYVADYPEQCLIAGCKESRCPICTVAYLDRGDYPARPLRPRAVSTTLAALANRKDTGLDSATFLRLGLRPIWPFWSNLPHVSIFATLTPDVLHQLHKGIFKDHLVKWSVAILGKAEVDQRFQRVPDHPGIRRFTRGISHVAQWTCKEHREMQKVFLTILAGSKQVMLHAAHALLDFIYISHFSTMTETTLADLDSALWTFHQHKKIFEKFVGKETQGFEVISKLHMIYHQTNSIRALGTPDGYSTEGPERYHADYSKVAFRASNRVQPAAQMTKYLQRQDSVRLWTAVQTWATGFTFRNALPADYIDAAESDITHAPEHSPASSPPLKLTTNPLVLSLPYPQPSHLIASRPLYPRQSLTWITTRLHIPAFLLRCNQFLQQRLPPHLRIHTLSHTDLFDIWTRFRVYHSNHSHQAIDSPIIEFIQAKPGTQASPHGLFTTMLIKYNADNQGIHKFRVARVRAIFKFPTRFDEHLKSTYLFVELFTPFTSAPKRQPCLFSVTPQCQSNGKVRSTAIIPLSDVVMSCHLVPRFEVLPESVWNLGAKADLLDNAPSFYLNEYSSHLMYAYMRDWKAL